RVAVRPFELSEPGRRKRARVLGRRERRGTGEHDAGDEGSRAAADHVAVVLDPGIPGDVISSGDRICASLSSGINLRSRTMSGLALPSFPAVLAISAVAVEPMYGLSAVATAVLRSSSSRQRASSAAMPLTQRSLSTCMALPRIDVACTA